MHIKAFISDLHIQEATILTLTYQWWSFSFSKARRLKSIWSSVPSHSRNVYHPFLQLLNWKYHNFWQYTLTCGPAHWSKVHWPRWLTIRWRCCSAYLHRHTTILSYRTDRKSFAYIPFLLTSTFVLINRYANLRFVAVGNLPVFFLMIDQLWAQWKDCEHKPWTCI